MGARASVTLTRMSTRVARRAKVVIVGGGIMGVSIAWHAARRADPLEETIVLLEKSELGAGSTGRSGAILRQHYSDREHAAMARDSLRVYAGIETKTGRSIGFQRTGVVTLAGPEAPETVDLVRRNVAMQRELGIDTRLVDAHELREIVPGIVVGDETIGAYEPGGGGVDPMKTVGVFATLAREHGAVTRTGVRALRLVRDGARVRGVETADGFVEAETTVVAAGPWSGPILAEVGVRLPLRVVRPEQMFLALPRAHGVSAPSEGERFEDTVLDRFGIERDRLAPAAHPVLLDLERGFYTRCEGHNRRTRVGRLDYSRDANVADPDALDEHVGESFRDWARAAIEQRLPCYRDEDDAGAQAALYTLTPDARACIGPWPGLEGLFVVTGFSGHGFKLGPSVGEGVAQLLFREPVSAFDPAFFRPDRPQHESGAFGL